jgi:hypothetical protein
MRGGSCFIGYMPVIWTRGPKTFESKEKRAQKSFKLPKLQAPKTK